MPQRTACGFRRGNLFRGENVDQRLLRIDGCYRLGIGWSRSGRRGGSRGRRCIVGWWVIGRRIRGIWLTRRRVGTRRPRHILRRRWGVRIPEQIHERLFGIRRKVGRVVDWRGSGGYRRTVSRLVRGVRLTPRRVGARRPRHILYGRRQIVWLREQFHQRLSGIRGNHNAGIRCGLRSGSRHRDIWWRGDSSGLGRRRR